MPVTVQQRSKTAGQRSSSCKRKSSSIGKVDQTKQTADRDSPTRPKRKTLTPGKQELSQINSCVLSPPVVSCKKPETDDVKLKIESAQANIMKNESISEEDVKQVCSSNLPDGNKGSTNDSSLLKKYEKAVQEKVFVLMNGSEDTQIKHVSDNDQGRIVVKDRVPNRIQDGNHPGVAKSPPFTGPSSVKEIIGRKLDYVTHPQKQKSIEANYGSIRPDNIEDRTTVKVGRNNKIGEKISEISKSSPVEMKDENKVTWSSKLKPKETSENIEDESSKSAKSAEDNMDVDDEFLETFVLDTQTAKSVICGIAKSVVRNKSSSGVISKESKGSQQNNNIFHDLHSDALFSEKPEGTSHADGDEKKPEDGHGIQVNDSIDDDLQLKLSESYESERNDLEMNVFHESNEEMFDNSVDIIAASNYERVGLSGETSNYKDRLNCSYEDLHIPYQSGQEACFEKADKGNLCHVETNVDTHYEKDKCSAVNNEGLFCCPESQTDANKAQKENDISFSSTFNISDVNVDALSEHAFTNKKKVNDYNQCRDDLVRKNDHCSSCSSNIRDSQKDKDHFGDSLTVSMIDQVFDNDNDRSAFSNPEKNSLSKQDCDTVDQKVYISEKIIEKDLLGADHVTPGECEIKIKSGTTMNKKFVTPKVRAIKRGRQTPGDRHAKVPKQVDINHSTPEAEKKDRMRKHIKHNMHPVNSQEKELNTEEKSIDGSRSEKKGSKTEDKKADQTTEEEQGQSPSIHNVSTGSDCVPPTPPSDDQLAPATTPKRTPLRTLSALAFSPRLKTMAMPDNTGNADQKPSNVASDLKTSDCLTEGRNSHDSNEDRDNCSEEEDADKLCPSFIDPEDSGVPLTQSSFSIIDVCGDKRLFKTFIMEWRTKSRYAVSVACERKSQNQGKDGKIGAKYRKGTVPVNHNLTLSQTTNF